MKQTHRRKAAKPASLPQLLIGIVIALLAVLFGGMPLSGGWTVRFRSAVIGAVAMAILKSGMSLTGIDGMVQQVVQGIILIVVVTLSFDRKNAAVIK